MSITLPAGIPIPASVAKAQAALDAAWERYSEAQIEYSDALDNGYLERAQARDAAAAKAATLAGKPVPKGESEVSRVTALRGTAAGVIEALEQQIRAADTVVYRAWSASAPELREQAVEALKRTEQEYADTELAFRRARGAFRHSVSALAAIDHMVRGKRGPAPVFIGNEQRGDSFTKLGRDWLKDNVVSVEPGDIVRVMYGGKVGEFATETAEKLVGAGVAALVDDDA
ncbi:hypothetical protein [Streptomyces sp. NBC_01361]|uniref:hypothetical protein n=1 Tax=Streptomyces sp. NBC_01361 TaxID=2903838 RepID=UPI002E31880E|nr:hypothetical protein [Streptomyces sp. NBC_01361]